MLNLNDLPPIGVPNNTQPCGYDHEGDHGFPTVLSAMDERHDGTHDALCRRCLRGHLALAFNNLQECLVEAEDGVSMVDGGSLPFLHVYLAEIAW